MQELSWNIATLHHEHTFYYYYALCMDFIWHPVNSHNKVYYSLYKLPGIFLDQLLMSECNNVCDLNNYSDLLKLLSKFYQHSL